MDLVKSELGLNVLEMNKLHVKTTIYLTQIISCDLTDLLIEILNLTCIIF